MTFHLTSSQLHAFFKRVQNITKVFQGICITHKKVVKIEYTYRDLFTQRCDNWCTAFTYGWLSLGKSKKINNLLKAIIRATIFKKKISVVKQKLKQDNNDKNVHNMNFHKLFLYLWQEANKNCLWTSCA